MVYSNGGARVVERPPSSPTANADGSKRSSWIDRQLSGPTVRRYGWLMLVGLLLGLVVVTTALTQRRSSGPGAMHAHGTWCDDDDEARRGHAPPLKCTSYDLTMRAEPLGDDGAASLAAALAGSRYGKPERRRLRRLILQHQDISSHGARRLAQLINACADGDAAGCALDPSKRFELDVRANPIGQRGVEQLRSAVERARSRGFRVVVFAGGKIEESFLKKGPLLKLGALEFQLGRKVEQKQYYDFEFRLPPTWQERVLPRDVSTTLRIRVVIAVVAFLCGILSTKLHLPVKVVWNEEAVVEAVKTTRRFTQFIGDTFRPGQLKESLRSASPVAGVQTATLHQALTSIRDDEDDDDDDDGESVTFDKLPALMRTMSERSDRDRSADDDDEPRRVRNRATKVFKPTTTRFA